MGRLQGSKRRLKEQLGVPVVVRRFKQCADTIKEGCYWRRGYDCLGGGDVDRGGRTVVVEDDRIIVNCIVAIPLRQTQNLVSPGGRSAETKRIAVHLRPCNRGA